MNRSIAFALTSMIPFLPAALPGQARSVTAGPLPVAARATTADLAWIAGTWEAPFPGGTGQLEVTITPPKAGIITGVMRLTDSGKVLVVELLTMVDTPDGVDLRFRHFSSALEAYEPKFQQQMHLTAHTNERYEFMNLVPYDKALMSTQPRVTTYTRLGPDRFLAHSDIIGDDGKPGVIEGTYHRMGASVSTRSPVPEQPLVSEGIVAAPLDSVWNAFTTKAGLESWMAAHADFELRVGGLMRTAYQPEATLGGPGTIENTILAYEPKKMLTIKVSKAPAGFPFPNAIQNMWSVIYFDAAGANQTRLREVSMGFGPDKESQKMRQFFERGNGATLASLQQRFAKKPN